MRRWGRQRSDTRKPPGRFRDEGGPEKWNGGISPAHDAILKAAPLYPATPGTREWTTAEFIKWQTGGDVFAFKDQWVKGHRDAIKAAAARYDLPPELVAGTAYNEVAGDPPIADDVAYKILNPLRNKPRNQTSFGDVSLQLRRAGQSLGYGGSPSEAQVDAIIASSKDPAMSIFMAAKHLADLRNIDFPGQAGPQMGKDELQITASRYNRGPGISLEGVKSNLDYGKDITKRWSHLTSLLEDAPSQ